MILGKKITVKKMFFFLIGMMNVALGMTLFVQSNVGAEPWSLLYAGISSATCIDIGTVIQLIGIFMVALVSIYDRMIPHIGTVMSFFTIGFFANIFNEINFLGTNSGIIWNLITFVLAILIMASGLGIYVSADLGEGSIELLQFFLVRKLNANIIIVRIVMDCTVSLIGFLLGGPLGFGTVISAFAIGPLLSFFLNLSNKYVFGKQ